MSISKKTVDLVERLKGLQGQSGDIRLLLQDQQSGRRQAYQSLADVIEVLSTLKIKVQEQMTNVASSMIQMNTSIETLLEDANRDQTAELKELSRVASELTPNIDEAELINKKLQAAIESLEDLLGKNPIEILPPPPPPPSSSQGGRRRRNHRGGYTYRKTKSPIRRTKRTRRTRN